MLYCTGPVHIFVARAPIIPWSSATIATKWPVTAPFPSDPPATITVTPPVPKPPDPPVNLDGAGNQQDMVNIWMDGGKNPNLPDQAAADDDEGQVGGVANDFFPLGIINTATGFASTAPIARNPSPRRSTRIPAYPFNPIAVFYLGTCEEAPQIAIRPTYRKLYQANQGRMVAWDKAYQGRDAVVITSMNNWNEWVYRIVAARMNARTATGGPRGVDLADAIGTLVGAEGVGVQLMLQYPLAAKQSNQDGGMPPGYRFMSASLMKEGVLPGNRPGVIDLWWECERIFDVNTGHSWLYDEDVSACPQLG